MAMFSFSLDQRTFADQNTAVDESIGPAAALVLPPSTSFTTGFESGYNLPTAPYDESDDPFEIPSHYIHNDGGVGDVQSQNLHDTQLPENFNFSGQTEPSDVGLSHLMVDGLFQLRPGYPTQYGYAEHPASDSHDLVEEGYVNTQSSTLFGNHLDSALSNAFEQVFPNGLTIHDYQSRHTFETSPIRQNEFNPAGTATGNMRLITVPPIQPRDALFGPMAGPIQEHTPVQADDGHNEVSDGVEGEQDGSTVFNSTYTPGARTKTWYDGQGTIHPKLEQAPLLPGDDKILGMLKALPLPIGTIVQAVVQLDWYQNKGKEEVPDEYKEALRQMPTAEMQQSIFSLFLEIKRSRGRPRYHCRICTWTEGGWKGESSSTRALGHVRKVHFNRCSEEGYSNAKTKQDVQNVRERNSKGLVCKICGCGYTVQNRSRHMKLHMRDEKHTKKPTSKKPHMGKATRRPPSGSNS